MCEYQDIVDHISQENIKLNLVPLLWNRINPSILRLVKNSDKWRTFKYLNDDGTLNDSGIKNINIDKGGIYIYYVSPEIIPERQRILIYVGRAHKTDSENLRDRVRSYYRFYRQDDPQRPKIRRLFANWGEYLFCSFIELDDNNTIDNIEKELINSLLPPCNASIPDVNISAAVRAFF